MRYRPLQKSSQWAALVGVPGAEEDLIRHYTLSGADVDRAFIKRGEHNQLGFAIQLCLMRFPGRGLGPNETPPSAMLEFVAQQLGIDPVVFTDYARRDETRREHATEIQQFLGLHTLIGRTGAPHFLPHLPQRMQQMMERSLPRQLCNHSERNRRCCRQPTGLIVLDLLGAPLPVAAPMQRFWAASQPNS